MSSTSALIACSLQICVYSIHTKVLQVKTHGCDTELAWLCKLSRTGLQGDRYAALHGVLHMHTDCSTEGHCNMMVQALQAQACMARPRLWHLHMISDITATKQTQHAPAAFEALCSS